MIVIQLCYEYKVCCKLLFLIIEIFKSNYMQKKYIICIGLDGMI